MMNRPQNSDLSSDGNESLVFDDQAVQRGIEQGRELRAKYWSGLLRNTFHWFAKLARWADSGIAAMRRRREYRRAVRELRELPDVMLKDIGIHRSEIRGLVYGYSQREPSMQDVPPGQLSVAGEQIAQPPSNIDLDCAA